MKKAMVVLLATVAMVLCYSYAMAGKGESPPEGSKLSGPNITGTMTFLPGEIGYFEGFCKNEAVYLDISALTPSDIASITVENLERYTQDLGYPGENLSVKCAPPKAEFITVFLSNVVQLDKEMDGDIVTKVTAKVVWNFLVPAK
jgi:hypothetical protein